MTEALQLFAAATLEANANHKVVDVTEEEREEVKSAEDLIMAKVAVGSKVKRESLERFLLDQGIDKVISRKAIMSLIKRKAFEDASNGSLKRVGSKM